jgi:hypothetical protein
MKPISIKEIKGKPILFAKDQPQYQTLPGYRYKDNVVICWGLSWKERFKVFFGGRVFVALKTGKSQLTPSYASTSFEEIKNVN